MAFVQAEGVLSEIEFWRTTPAKLIALIQALNNRIKREDYRSAIIATLIRAACGAKNADVWEFYNHHRERPIAENNGKLSAAEVRANFQAFIKGHKGDG